MPADRANVLFIGNSFTTKNDLPGLLREIARVGQGITVESRVISAGGASLRRHWNAGAARAITGGEWDYVVLQEQSTLPIKNSRRFHENVREFVPAIEESGARLVLFMTWARQGEPENQSLLTSSYLQIGEELGATVVPAGTAWQLLLAEHDPPALHAADGSHPTFAGSYLAACTFYAALFRGDPVGVEIDAGDLSPEDRKLLQRIAGAACRQVDLKGLLSRPALGIGAGSATDSGFAWTLPSEVENPIVLSAGIPDPDSLPVQDLRVAFDRVLTESRDQALRYGGVLGFEGLRRALAERYNALEAIRSGPENYLIGNGSAGCIDNICDAFLDPGDVVIVEGPTFSGSTRTIKGHQAEIVQISLDRHGLMADGLPSVFRRVEESGKRVKLLYTVCDFQNPTGTTLPPERRRKIIDLCREHRTLIVEDSVYADIYFDIPPPPSIYALAGGQGVLQVGSFSKILATGLRMGWVRGRGDFIEALARVRYDMGNSPLLQRALEAYLQSGKLDHHLGRVRALYARKCETLSLSLRQHCSQYFNFNKPAGGFYLWIDCLGPKARDVRREASRVGVVFPLGSTFFLDQERDDSTHLRLAFSTASLSELETVGPLLKLACDRAVGETEP